LTPRADAGLVEIVMAREPLPGKGSPAIFLAGPSPSSDDVPSWRPGAIDLLRASRRAADESLTVLSPESRGGRRATGYDEQVGWEAAARAAATVILFWIPRDLRRLPGFTTNVEFGLDVGLGRKVVLGAPPDCPNPERNRYLIHVARRHGVPIFDTLDDAAAHALTVIAGAP
jgi:hypothetical protein